MRKRVSILGSGISGVGAAILAKDKGYEVFVSDSNEITSNVKNKLDFISIPWEENKHSYAELKKSDLVIKSPGISNESEIIVKLKNSNVKIISEIEFASTHTNSFIIGITGSNGKTTTTKLIYHILKNSGLNVGIAGNIGTSFSKQIAENKFDYYVLEISSFQLDDIVDFKPNIAIITNLFEDHLDRYSSFDDYCKAKINLLRNMNKDDLILYNHDDKVLLEEIKKIDMPSTSYSLDKEHSQFYFEDNQIKSSSSDECLLVDDCNLKGIHNISNMIAVATVASKLGVDDERILSFMKQYEGLEHRFEFVRELNGVTFINDSKATNVSSVEAAIKSIGKNIVLIMGGLSKDSDFSKISDYNDAIKLIVAYGVAAKEITSSLSSSMRVVEQDKFEDAIKNAFDLAEEGDCVLMSPACASFDQFENYEHRGSFFKDVVNKLS